MTGRGTIARHRTPGPQLPPCARHRLTAATPRRSRKLSESDRLNVEARVEAYVQPGEWLWTPELDAVHRLFDASALRSRHLRWLRELVEECGFWMTEWIKAADESDVEALFAFSSPQVTQGLAGFGKGLDSTKTERLLIDDAHFDLLLHNTELPSESYGVRRDYAFRNLASPHGGITSSGDFYIDALETLAAQLSTPE